ncbi:hypothetical protein [Cellulosilyticum ruminicola]|uniref:hypothetical protein n=1 Tax=Cellulosilyticum ruminicola TaxID=425254 RepID=UPI0006D29F50|nr:hypothetical protein [Cellulosilyticum ruminicola]
MAQYLEGKGYKKVAIYGYADFGKLAYNELKDSNIEVSYVIDRNVKNIQAPIEIVEPKDINKQVDAIIVTAFRDFENIACIIKAQIETDVLALDDVILKM